MPLLSTRIAAIATIVMLGGCATPNHDVVAQPRVTPADAVHAPATLDELPDLASKYERTIAAKVGVQDYNKPPRIRIVGDLKEPPLTPEEKAALGEDKPKPGDDLLAFYRPQRGPEHGVHPYESRVTAGAYGHGGTFVGLGPATRYYGFFGIAGYNAGIDRANRTQAASYNQVTSKTGVGPESRVHSGEGEARRGATHADRLD